MKEIVSIFILLMNFNIAYSQVKIEEMTVRKIPAFGIEGRWGEKVRWSDKLGDNIAILTSKHETDSLELFAYRYLINETSEQVWKMHEIIICNKANWGAKFIENSLQITDLDKNGIAEVWFAYHIFCSDIEIPFPLKIVLYQNSEKSVLIGKYYFDKMSSTDDYLYTLDSNMAMQNSEMKDFAIKMLREIQNRSR